MTEIGLILFLAVVAPTHRQLAEAELAREPGRLYQAMGLAVYASQAADFASTEYRLSQGSRELNPLMQHRWARASTVVAVPLVANWGTDRVRDAGHPRVALWVRIAAVAVNGYLVARHLR